MQYTRQTKRAFTLIELLVVIAIISILASILFPVFARARENARRASCMSNMKQIGLGLMQYTQDYDERYPPGWHCGTNASSCPDDSLDDDPSKPSGVFVVNGNSSGQGHYQTWMDFIYPYVKSTQIFICPSNTVVEITTVTPPGPTPSYGYSFAFNNYGNYASVYFGGPSSPAPIGDPHGWSPISMASVTRPSEVICITEYTRPYGYTMGPRDFRGQAATLTNTLVTPHLDGGNAVYADGHVKWRSRQTILSNIGPTNTACNISAPNYDYLYCSRSWNPFLP